MTMRYEMQISRFSPKDVVKRAESESDQDYAERCASLDGLDMWGIAIADGDTTWKKFSRPFRGDEDGRYELSRLFKDLQKAILLAGKHNLVKPKTETK